MDIFDLLTPGRLIIRRPSGAVYLDSADRTLVKLGARTYTNIAIDFPAFTTERFSKARITSGGIYQDWSIGREAFAFSKTLGAIGTDVPNWLVLNIKGRNIAPEKQEVFYAITKNSQFVESQWLALNGGSLWVQQCSDSNGSQLPIFQRILNVRPSGSNFVVACKQSSRAFAKNDAPVSGWGSASSFLFDFSLTWGVFDL